jgi:hypothetical protein
MNLHISRRRFLGVAGAIAGSAALGKLLTGQDSTAKKQHAYSSLDDETLHRVLDAVRPAAAGLTMGDLVARIGGQFLGAPYAAHTLEEKGEEHLIVNLRAFDCVTFLETSLALARTIRLPGQPEEVFRNELQRIRYRGGVIDGYTSRLHYFSEWIADNERKGIVQDMTRMLDGVRDKRGIYFMTSHRTSYRQMSDNKTAEAIAAIEKRLSVTPRFVIPVTRLPMVLHRLQSGDLIGVTTNIEGLDVSHTGMIVVDGPERRFLHASSSVHAVVLSKDSITEYLHDHEEATGIVAARPLEAGT